MTWYSTVEVLPFDAFKSFRLPSKSVYGSRWERRWGRQVMVIVDGKERVGYMTLVPAILAGERRLSLKAGWLVMYPNDMGGVDMERVSAWAEMPDGVGR